MLKGWTIGSIVYTVIALLVTLARVKQNVILSNGDVVILTLTIANALLVLVANIIKYFK